MLGWLERRLGLKPMIMHYAMEIEGPAEERMNDVNSVLESFSLESRGMRLSKTGGKQKLVFSVDATRRQQKNLMREFRQSDDLRGYDATAGPEHE